MDDRARAQLRVIDAVVQAFDAADISAWLFGGWGLDAALGRVTRDHGDVELWVERGDAARSTAVLVGLGAEVLATQPIEESTELTLDGTMFSTAYFDARPDGTYGLEGRWSDWVFPPGSFGDDHGVLDGRRVPTMSPAGMLAMKEQYPSLRNGRPSRPKDVADIGLLRPLVR